MARKPPPRSGKRFSALTEQLAARDVQDPKALAAYIGRKKYGKQEYAQLAASGRK